jgi:hypothetical protein
LNRSGTSGCSCTTPVPVLFRLRLPHWSWANSERERLFRCCSDRAPLLCRNDTCVPNSGRVGVAAPRPCRAGRELTIDTIDVTLRGDPLFVDASIARDPALLESAIDKSPTDSCEPVHDHRVSGPSCTVEKSLETRHRVTSAGPKPWRVQRLAKTEIASIRHRGDRHDLHRSTGVTARDS